MARAGSTYRQNGAKRPKPQITGHWRWKPSRQYPAIGAKERARGLKRLGAMK